MGFFEDRKRKKEEKKAMIDASIKAEEDYWKAIANDYRKWYFNGLITIIQELVESKGFHATDGFFKAINIPGYERKYIMYRVKDKELDTYKCCSIYDIPMMEGILFDNDNEKFLPITIKENKFSDFIDGKKFVLHMANKPFSYSDIFDISISYSEEQIMKVVDKKGNTTSRAVAGAMLGGTAGAIIGATTGQRETITDIYSEPADLSLNIKISSAGGLCSFRYPFVTKDLIQKKQFYSLFDFNLMNQTSNGMDVIVLSYQKRTSSLGTSQCDLVASLKNEIAAIPDIHSRLYYYVNRIKRSTTREAQKVLAEEDRKTDVIIQEEKHEVNNEKGQGRNIVNQLEQLTLLKQDGALTDEEFQIAKRRILGI